MKTFRPLRISGLIQEQLGKIIIKEMDLPFGDFVTISNVQVTDDLEHAKINISVIPTSSSENIIKILTKSAGHLQFLLNRKLNIKPIPRIEFHIDYGLAKAAEVEKLLLKK